MINVIINDKVVSASRNLRGMRDYARKHGVDTIGIIKAVDRAICFVYYANGAQCRTEWASLSVCKDRMARWKYFSSAKRMPLSE